MCHPPPASTQPQTPDKEVDQHWRWSTSILLISWELLCQQLYLTQLVLSTRNSGRLCLKQLFPKGEDDISEEIHLELDLPSFDRWICIVDHPSQLRSILLIIYLSWEQIEWSGSWVFYSNPFSQLHLFSTFTTCPLSIFNPFQQNSWTGFALQLLGQSRDFRSWSNEEKCKINMDRGATDYFMNLKFSHLSLTKVSQLSTSGPIARSPDIPGSTSTILLCWWLIKTTCGK